MKVSVLGQKNYLLEKRAVILRIQIKALKITISFVRLCGHCCTKFPSDMNKSVEMYCITKHFLLETGVVLQGFLRVPFINHSCFLKCGPINVLFCYHFFNL